MMAWENLEEPINENENDEDNNSFEDEEYEKENLKEDEEAADEHSETSCSTDYVNVNEKEFEENILLPGNMRTEPQYINLRNWKENTRRKD